MPPCGVTTHSEEVPIEHISILAEVGREEAVASDKWEGLGKASGMTGGGVSDAGR